MIVAGLVLAAGAGRRFGRPKATVVLDGERLVDRAVRTVRAGGCDLAVVVLGAEVVAVPTADEVVVNPGWVEGLGSSLRAGLGAVARTDPVVDAVVVVLCDQPWLGAEAIRSVVAGVRVDPARSRSALVAATFGGVRSHPVLIGADHWAGVAALAAGDVGARAYLQLHHASVVEVPCDGHGDPRDVDRPDDLRWVAPEPPA